MFVLLESTPYVSVDEYRGVFSTSKKAFKAAAELAGTVLVWTQPFEADGVFYTSTISKDKETDVQWHVRLVILNQAVEAYVGSLRP